VEQISGLSWKLKNQGFTIPAYTSRKPVDSVFIMQFSVFIGVPVFHLCLSVFIRGKSLLV
jgi:hypothetical protein